MSGTYFRETGVLWACDSIVFPFPFQVDFFEIALPVYADFLFYAIFEKIVFVNISEITLCKHQLIVLHRGKYLEFSKIVDFLENIWHWICIGIYYLL